MQDTLKYLSDAAQRAGISLNVAEKLSEQLEQMNLVVQKVENTPQKTTTLRVQPKKL